MTEPGVLRVSNDPTAIAIKELTANIAGLRHEIQELTKTIKTICLCAKTS